MIRRNNQREKEGERERKELTVAANSEAAWTLYLFLRLRPILASFSFSATSCVWGDRGREGERGGGGGRVHAYM